MKTARQILRLAKRFKRAGSELPKDVLTYSRKTFTRAEQASKELDRIFK